MKQFLKKETKLVFATIALVLWSPLFILWSSWVNEIPLSEPIELTSQGHISKLVDIHVPEHYRLEMVFERHGHSFDELNQLLGDRPYGHDGKSIPSGTGVPIHWSLLRLSDRSVVVSERLDSFGANGWSNDNVYRSIGHLHVPAGQYLFEAQILSDLPELKGFHARLLIAPYPKSVSTWQTAFDWLGSIGTIFLVWPLTVIACAILIFKLLVHLFRGKGLHRPNCP